MPKRRRQKGFTIVEILIAIMVISIALLGTVAAIGFGLRASHQGSDNTVAIQINRKVMELLMQSIISPDVATFNHGPGSVTALRGAAPWRPVCYNPQQANWFSLKNFGYVSGTADATRFLRDTENYELDVSSVKQSKPNVYSVDGRFYLLTVTTRWQDAKGGRADSSGKAISRWKSITTTSYSVAGAD